MNTPQWTRVGCVLLAIALAGLGTVMSSTSTALATQNETSRAYCEVETAGTTVEVMRPQPSDDLPVIDDVNWFARPVPNPDGHWIVAYGSHNLNYLYDLTSGIQIRIPDESDAVATPDGRYMTVPSHYTATDTVNFYDLPTFTRPTGPRRGCLRRTARLCARACRPRRCLLPVDRRRLGTA